MAVVALSGPLRAAPGARVGVVPFSGVGEGPLRAAVLKSLKANGFVTVGGRQIQGTVDRLGVTLDEDGSFAAVAKDLGLSALVVGEVGKKRATVTIRNGADGSVAAEALFSATSPNKLKSAVAGGFWRRLGSAVGRCRPPAGGKPRAEVAEEAPPADDDEAEAAASGKETAGAPRAEPAGAAEDADQPPGGASSKPAPESETARSPDEDAQPPRPRRRRAAAAPSPEIAPAKAPSPIALELGIGGKAMFRRLTWHQVAQDPQMRIAPYALSPGAEVGSWLELYPAAFATDGPLADLGLVGAFDYGLGVKSRTPTGTLLTTKFQDFTIGLKLRLPLGAFDPFASVAYGQQSFRLESASGTAPVPAVGYRLGRFGAGGRLIITPALFLDFEGAYLRVFDLGTELGEIGGTDYFPRGTGYAVDADASLGIRLGSVLALRAGVDFRQYGLDFNVRQTDALIVGGAVDRYVSVWGGLEIALDGTGGASGDAGPAVEPAQAPRPGRRVKAPRPTTDEDE